MFFERMVKGGIVAALVIGGAVTASAQVLNGGFEQGGGSLSSWGSAGDAFASDGSIFPTPYEGTHQGTVATSTDGSFGEPAGNGVSESNAESSLELSSNALTNVGNGSVVNVSTFGQTVHLTAGEHLIFHYDFLTNQTNNDPSNSAFAQRPSLDNDDFAFFSVSSSQGNSVQKLADVFYGYQDLDPSDPAGFKTGFKTTPVSDPFISETGYLTGVFTPTTTDNYLFGFGVANAFTSSTNGVNSGLVVDGVFVTPAPEPSAMAAMALGLIGLTRRRNSKKR